MEKIFPHTVNFVLGETESCIAVIVWQTELRKMLLYLLVLNADNDVIAAITVFIHAHDIVADGLPIITKNLCIQHTHNTFNSVCSLYVLKICSQFAATLSLA